MASYYASNGQRHGPMSEEDFHDLVRRGVIAPEALVWTSGMAEWRRLAEVAPNLPPPLLPASGTAPADGAPSERPQAAATTAALPQVAGVAVSPRSRVSGSACSRVSLTG